MKRCPYCAEEIRDEAIKCKHCRSWLQAPATVNPALGWGDLSGCRLTRSSRNRMIAGVCGGLAEYLGMDASLMRVLYILCTFFTAVIPGVLVYIILALIIPSDHTPVSYY